MLKTSHTDGILESGGFWLHSLVGKYRKLSSFISQTLVITAICAVVMFLASLIDGSLYLPGRDVGFVEHPAVWGFLVLQTVLPISVAGSIEKLSHATIEDGEIVNKPEACSDLILPSVREFLKLRHRYSRLAAALLYAIGLVAWGINSIQNQFPHVVVPYDFWDSKTYLLGYIVTRFYKAYLFIVLLPYLALVHTAILASTLRIIRNSRVAGQLRLLPFHPDRSGGLSFVAGLISKPIILTLLVGAGTTTGALMVHRALDLTPALGLGLLLIWAILAYIVPILFLRTDIVAMKRELIKKIRRAQQVRYSSVLEGQPLESRVVEEENEALEYFDRVCDRIDGISSLPHWKRLFASLSLALTPSLITFVLKWVGSLSAITTRLTAPP
jgi:hypothetical protein